MTEPTRPEFHVLQADVFAANTTLIVRDNTVVIVDAGVGVTGQVTSLIERNGWDPLGLFITHGHVDHTWDAAALSAALDIPVLIHEADRYYLDDPFGIDPDFPERRDPSRMLVQAFASFGLRPDLFTTPNRIETLGSDAAAESSIGRVWGGQWRWIAAPGHTPGATIYVFGDEADSAALPLACTGDVLFARSVGRTDLPGGDHRIMADTLEMLCTALRSETLLIPGHGPTTTMGDELAFNPYLRSGMM